MPDVRIANAAAIAMCNAAVDLIDGGAGAGLLRIYDGARPADPDVAVGAQVLLAELTMSDPAFGNAVDANPGGQATANAITADGSANASGTATWCRIVDSNGVAILDGDVGATASGAFLELNTTAITAGQNVSVSSMTLTQPES
ncbi:hypothetical protein [Pelagibius sp.]|uniref:hypothetical protein n=1 Tax=Pelagibius sp. TaxID=1931238 RepID=UPI00261FEF7A|nr:hypothetical protein [Pelagibius sp.]